MLPSVPHEKVDTVAIGIGPRWTRISLCQSHCRQEDTFKVFLSVAGIPCEKYVQGGRKRAKHPDEEIVSCVRSPFSCLSLKLRWTKTIPHRQLSHVTSLQQSECKMGLGISLIPTECFPYNQMMGLS